MARALAGELSPVEIAFWRWGLAFFLLFPFTWRMIPAYWSVIRNHLFLLLVMGVLGVSVLNTLNYKAGETTEAVNIALIATSSPVFMALIARFVLHESFSGRQAAGFAVALAGVVVLITKGSFDLLLGLSFSEGDLWALGAAVLFAVYSIQVRFRPHELPQAVFLTVIFAIGILGLSPFLLWKVFVSTTAQWPSLPQWGSLLYIGLGASVLGFTFWNMAIDRIGSVRSGVVYYSIPLFSSVEAAFLLDENLTFAQMCGGILIIGGILFSGLSVLQQSAK